MLLEAIKQFNWVDVFVVILLLTTTYRSVRNGFFVTFFKLMGTLLAAFLALHYFTNFGDLFEASIPTPPHIPLEIWDVLGFLILSILGYAAFVILREAFFKFVKTETVSILNRWGASILGIARGFILTSLVIFLLSIPVIDYFGNSIRSSFFAKRLIKVSTGTYTYLWNSFVSKFMPKGKFNDVVLEVQEEVLM